MMPTYPKAPRKSISLQARIHPRHKFNLWLAIQRRLATVDRLQKFGIDIPKDCIFCARDEETFDHFFFTCSHTRTIWGILFKWLGHTRRIGSWQEEVDWINRLAKRKNGRDSVTCYTFAMMIYCIWHLRNSMRCQGARMETEKMYREIAMHIHIKGRKLAN
ncbi:uncharacterized protein LOC132043877 [Lycium ferocissimum]|uniref:uncharacterized protein LOC132043877 n=1 Tax=Lycium ferocissimum TaxID=112874 RepID=UPI0028152FD9|nr:uncharacterized protein LOC132043877 [Lycium ferocissimum]